MVLIISGITPAESSLYPQNENDTTTWFGESIWQAIQQTSGHLLFNSDSLMDEEQANPTGINQILSHNFLLPQFERDVA